MKRYSIFILLAAAVAMAACQEKELSDKEKLDSLPRVPVEVSYSVDGQDITSLSWTSSPMIQEIDVNVNDENLRWNLESNREWCKVRQESHRGPGKVILEVLSNEDFEPRQEATLTFVAGDYRGFRIKANQNAAAFIVGQPYFVMGKEEGFFSVNVTTREGADWTISPDSWLAATKGASSTVGGFTTTEVTCTTSVNNSATRFGSVTLKSGAETGHIYVSQFGTDLQYDEDGNIFFAKGKPAVLQFDAPRYTISSFDVPSFATAEVDESGNGETVKVTITLEDNYSDCGELREANVSMTLTNLSASTVALPKIQQDYTAANGLMTGLGFQRFAQAVNSGESTADWEKNGKVVMLKDIDMSEIEGWEGIGTAEHPFSGTFDGNGYAIVNMKKALSGIFNVVKDASISNVSFGKGCSIYNGATFSGDARIGGVANQATGSTFTSCTAVGTVEFAGKSEDEGTLCVGGIVGWCDPSSKVTTSKTTGNVIFSSTGTGDSRACVGGIVGYTKGEVSNCEFSGTLKNSSGATMVSVGGILSDVTADTKVSGNAFLGTIILAGAAAKVDIGGLYGVVSSGTRTFDNASDKSLAMGSIEIESYLSDRTETFILAGGMVGRAGTGVTLGIKGYEVQTNFTMKETSAIYSALFATGGALGGCRLDDEKAASITIDDVKNSGVTTINYPSGIKTQHLLGFHGGVAGFINGPAVIKDCTNEGGIGKTGSNGASSNDLLKMIGGIVGGAEGGDMNISGCVNKGTLYCGQYCNRLPKVTYQGRYCTAGAAGIIGVFEYTPTPSGSKITIDKCSSLNALGAYRGYTAGMVCYANNATITNCVSRGDMLGTNSSHKGGIAGALTGTCVVSDCEVKCSMHSASQGGATGSPGGIVSIDLNGDVSGNNATSGSVTIQNCSYFGSIDGAGTPTNAGIIGIASDVTVVKDCKYGGKQQGVDVSENNVASFITGNGKGTVSGVTYWNGG